MKSFLLPALIAGLAITAPAARAVVPAVIPAGPAGPGGACSDALAPQKPRFMSDELWVLLKDLKPKEKLLGKALDELHNFYWENPGNDLSKKKRKKLGKLVRRTEELEAEVRVKKAKFSQLAETTDRDNVIRELTAREATPAIKQLIDDFLRAEAVFAVAPASLVSFAVGNPGEAADEGVYARVEKLASALLNGGFGIVYSGGTAYDPLFAQLETQFPGKTYSISPATIANDYLRLEALSHAEQVVTFEQSLVGQATLLRGDSTFHIATGANYLNEWRDKLEESHSNLGLKRSSATFVEDAYALLNFEQPPAAKRPMTGTFRKVPSRGKARYESLNWGKLYDILEYTEVMPGATARLNAEIGAGSIAFFGSGNSNIPASYNQWIYDGVSAVAALGVPVTTGGAGGFMRVANTAAYAQGAPSIGIPISGRKSLATEKKIFSSVQTLTVEAADYNSRIPLLLHGQKWIVFLPGGSGTVNELATTLSLFSMQLSRGAKAELPRLAFYGSGYWVPLLRQLVPTLPPQIRERIYYTDSPEELAKFIQTVTPELVRPVSAQKRVVPESALGFLREGGKK